MVLLVAKINKLYSKLENLHHHHHSQTSEAVLSASFEGFLCDIVSNGLSKLLSSSEAMSFSWIHQCLELIPITTMAFAKLVVAIDHPASKWRANSAEAYLKYTLNLLELFNSISSSLSHLGQARVSLSHGLNLREEKPPSLALRHLKAIEPLGLANKDLVIRKGEEEEEKGSCSSKEEVIHKAIMVMESLGFWVCGVVLSSLCGDDNKPYSEIRRHFGGLFVLHSSFARMDSSGILEAMVEKKVELIKEVKDVNDSVACLAAAIGDGKSSSDDEAEELRRRLEVFERALEGFGTEVDRLFKNVLRERNQLLSGFQVQRRKE